MCVASVEKAVEELQEVATAKVLRNPENGYLLNNVVAALIVLQVKCMPAKKQRSLLHR